MSTMLDKSLWNDTQKAAVFSYIFRILYEIMVIYRLHKKPIWFEIVQIEHKNFDLKSNSEHALSISRKTGNISQRAWS